MKINSNFNNKENSISAILIILTIIILYYHFILSHQVTQIQNTNNKIFVTNREIQELEIQKADLTNLKNEINTIENSNRIVEERIPYRLRIADLILQIDEAIKMSHMKLLHISYEKPLKTDEYYTVSIHLQLEGTYEDSIGFLRELDNCKRFFDIGKFEILDQKIANEVLAHSSTKNINITLRTYSMTNQ